MREIDLLQELDAAATLLREPHVANSYEVADTLDNLASAIRDEDNVILLPQGQRIANG